MNYVNLTTEELLAEAYIKSPSDPLFAAIVARLEEALDDANELNKKLAELA